MANDMADGGSEAVPSYHLPCGEATYASCLDKKRLKLLQDFGGLYQFQLLGYECHTSPIVEFRSRCRFQIVRAASGSLEYALREGGAPFVINDFPMALRCIRDIMYPLLRSLELRNSLCDGLEAISFLGNKSGDVLVTLVYSAAIDAGVWMPEACAFAAQFDRLHLIGRSKGLALTTGANYVIERYALNDGRVLSYKHTEGAFSNPNASITVATMNFLCSVASDIVRTLPQPGSGGGGYHRLLELYCGNGNHTCALAPAFESVVAVEISQKLVDAATENLITNGVHNASVLCSNSRSVAKQLMRQQLRSSDEDGRTVRLEEFSTILVDPPRAGLDSDTLRLAAMFDHILYVSCGPDALLRNISDGLEKTHAIQRFAILDHFPYTQHIEVAVYLTKKHRPAP